MEAEMEYENQLMSVTTNATLPEGCNYTLMGEEHFIECVLGEQHMALTTVVPMTIAYMIIFLTGIFGNVCTCIVISKNQNMHTATNAYLFSLAISDLLILLLGMPFDLYQMWKQYPWTLGSGMCFLKNFLLEMTTNASILTITAFTVERYVAICHPLWAHKFCSMSRAIKSIVAIWVVASATAIQIGLLNEVNYLVDDQGNKLEGSFWCATHFLSDDPLYVRKVVASVLFSTVMFFVVPMHVLAILYLLIGYALSNATGLVRNDTTDNSSPAAQDKQKQNQLRKSVVRMLAAVVLAFFICWAPYHAQRITFIYCITKQHWSTFSIKLSEVMFILAGTLYYTSSTINPILYNVMSKKYRQAFRNTLCRWCIPEGAKKPRISTSYAPVFASKDTTNQVTVMTEYCVNGGTQATGIAEDFV